MIKITTVLTEAEIIPSWTTREERACVAELAQEAPQGGSVLEVGCLYGGMTAVMGLANPTLKIRVIDNFSWTPEGYPTTSAELVWENMKKVGVQLESITTEDSRLSTWSLPLDLLWIDGGHSYEFVKNDLDKFGPWAQVIALHDYDNPFWPTIKQAVDDFLKDHPEFTLLKVQGTVAVLNRR